MTVNFSCPIISGCKKKRKENRISLFPVTFSYKKRKNFVPHPGLRPPQALSSAHSLSAGRKDSSWMAQICRATLFNRYSWEIFTFDFSELFKSASLGTESHCRTSPKQQNSTGKVSWRHLNTAHTWRHHPRFYFDMSDHQAGFPSPLQLPQSWHKFFRHCPVVWQAGGLMTENKSPLAT